MDKIYSYNPKASYKPNEVKYSELMSATDFYIQNITVSECDNHVHSLQFKFLNVFYELCERRNENYGSKIY